MKNFISILLAIIVILGIGALGALVVMLLWNWLVPLFWSGAPVLGFWQTWGIIILVNIIIRLIKR